jgi:hypothetical protein
VTYTFALERPDGTPADPPTMRLAVYTWRSGDTIPLGRRSLRVVSVREEGEDEPPILVVEDLAE